LQNDAARQIAASKFMNPGASLSRLSLSRAYGARGAPRFRALRPQHRVQRPEEKGSVAGLDVNPLKGALAKSVVTALAAVLSILPDSRPGGARQSEDAAALSEEGPAADARPPSPPPPFGEMTAEDILEYCDDHPRELQTGAAMALVQRLYDIALFEHDITEERAKKALKRIEALRRDINAASIHDDKSLSQFEEDCTSAVETASRFGRGSLLWKLVEDKVPDPKIAEYITRPEHRILLHTYLHVTGSRRVQNLRPVLILNLVKQPLFPGVRDPVVTLHALAMGGDPALAALFNAAEIHAFINVPDDYDAACLTLAKAGVAVGRNPLSMLRNPRNLSAIPDIVNSIIVKRSRNDPSDARMAALQPDAINFFTFILVSLRYSLARRVLTQYYGSSTGEALFQLSSKSVQMGIERLDVSEAGLSDIKCSPSINYHLIRGLIEDYCSESNGMLRVLGGHEIDVGAQLICSERAQFIDDLHKNLRSWTY
jgi:hypothetical protein